MGSSRGGGGMGGPCRRGGARAAAGPRAGGGDGGACRHPPRGVQRVGLFQSPYYLRRREAHAALQHRRGAPRLPRAARRAVAQRRRACVDEQLRAAGRRAWPVHRSRRAGAACVEHTHPCCGRNPVRSRQMRGRLGGAKGMDFPPVEGKCRKTLVPSSGGKMEGNYGEWRETTEHCVRARAEGKWREVEEKWRKKTGGRGENRGK
eukprot:gene7341-biopygen10565